MSRTKRETDQNKIEIDIEQHRPDINRALKLAEQTQVMAIKNDNDASRAAEMLVRLREVGNILKSKRDELLSPIKVATQRIKNFFDPAIKKIEGAETIIRNSLTQYRTEQEKRAAIERARLQQIAEERARQEREELLQRIKQEKNKEIKQELMRQVEEIGKVVVPEIKPVNPAGVAFREVWKYRIIDFSALPDEFKLPDETKLNQHARTYKNTVPVPGVEFYSEKVPVIKQ